MVHEVVYSLIGLLILCNYVWISLVKQILTLKNNNMKKFFLVVALILNSFISTSQGLITNINQICDSLELYPCSQGINYIDQGTNAYLLIFDVQVNNLNIVYTHNSYWLVTNLEGDTLFEDSTGAPFIPISSTLDTIIISLTLEVIPSIGEAIMCTVSDTMYYNNNTGLWTTLIYNSITYITEYDFKPITNNKFFDILGRPIKNYYLIPNNSIYILNNKKYIKIK